MKKTLTTLALLLAISAGLSAENKPKAVNDTTLVAGIVRFDKETFPSKTGEKKEIYTATTQDGQTLPSNKTSAKRYELIRRHGGTPAVVLITTPSGKKRIAVL